MSSFASPTTNTGLRNRLGTSDKPVTTTTSVPTPTPAPAPAPAPTPAPTANVGYRLPEYVTLQNAIKWAIIEDKPIMMDYWADSLEKKVLIGVKENQEKLLVKSVDEYTSPVVKIFKHNTDFIIMTENSIYLVDSSIDVKRIS
jgi:hypothetical protein